MVLIVLVLVVVLVLERWGGCWFDQAASGRLQVRIGTQTTRSIEDDDEDDYEARTSSWP
jgi:hypothetical protein